MKVKIPEFRKLSSYRSPSVTIVVGCGGTGGYVIGPLARILKVHHGVGNRLVLVDGDDVEEKNLKRQHFIKHDLGRNKAEVMAARYSAALGIQIEAIPEYIEDASVLQQLQPGIWGSCTMVIGCVDNNASRQVIHEWFTGPHSVGRPEHKFWIDSGNEEESGQVVCGYRPPDQTRTSPSLFSMPCVTELYPELLKGDMKFNSQLSCAELAAAAPQNMMANVTAATLILNFAQRIIYGQPLASHGTSFTIDNVFRTMLNTDEALAAVDDARRPSWEDHPKKKKKKSPRKKTTTRKKESRS